MQSDPIGLSGGMNTYAYVKADPQNSMDPQGLFKVHGNWCGPDMTGGYRKPYNQLDSGELAAALPPIDDLDMCCQSHDIDYGSCRDICDPKERSQCFKDADRQLGNCSGIAGGGRSFGFGNASDTIEDYMSDSNPSPGPAPDDCECQE